MWLWEAELIGLGFRRSGRAGRCWVCRNRYGLGSWGHLTLFDPDPAPPIQRHRRRRRTRTRLPPRAIDVEGFHVTAEVGDQNIHFYYREGELGVWTREGQTPSGDIRALGANPIAMRQQADAVAQAMVEKLGGLLTEDLGNTWY